MKIIIAGGGPVGLFLGICLSQKGIECTILEKRAAPVTDSRSLGIHPVSLGLFKQLGIVDDFLEAGVQIKKGIAHDGKKKMGEVDFSQLKPPFNFVLACPQFETERILEKQFTKLNPNGLIREAEVVAVTQNEKNIMVRFNKNGIEESITSNFVIGCDGKNSFVRQETGIFFGGKRYPDTYIMGDFEENTSFGKDAVVFLPKQGMVECFPLPNGMRRWVVKTNQFIEHVTQEKLSGLVLKRLGYDLSSINHSMLSSFGVQHFMAEYFVKNKIILVGDAAHVVSPIGGQGMNLGWLGAWKLAEILKVCLENPSREKELLHAYESKHKKVVKKAAKRAEWNMKMGRKHKIPFAKKALIHVLLHTPLSSIAARKFTMHGLG